MAVVSIAVTTLENIVDQDPAFFYLFRSDKARWISALSRPHPEIDFSAAQGKVFFFFFFSWFRFCNLFSLW